MSTTIVFKSLEKSNIRYRWASDRFEYGDAKGAWQQVTYYDTLGDGECQHTPECRLPDSMLGDAMASFAAYIESATLSSDDVESLASRLPDVWYGDLRNVRKAVELFRTKAVYKDDDAKTRYYSLSELGVSSSESKRHDKRWHRIDSMHDGSLSAIVSMIHIGDDGYSRYNDMASYWIAVDVIRDIIAEQTNCYTSLKVGSEDKRCELHDSITMLRRASEAIRARNYLSRGIACYRNNLENRKASAVA